MMPARLARLHNRIANPNDIDMHVLLTARAKSAAATRRKGKAPCGRASRGRRRRGTAPLAPPPYMRQPKHSPSLFVDGESGARACRLPRLPRARLAGRHCKHAAAAARVNVSRRTRCEGARCCGPACSRSSEFPHLWPRRGSTSSSLRCQKDQAAQPLGQPGCAACIGAAQAVRHGRPAVLLLRWLITHRWPA